METYLHTRVRDASYREICDFEGPGRGEMAFRGTAVRGVLIIGTKSMPMMPGGEEAARPSAPDSTGLAPPCVSGPRSRSRWSGDYLWMYPAMLLMLLVVASVAAAVLLTDYSIQVTVMQPSLEKDQLDGWAMQTQYNPIGVFVALEELGYLLMSVALACVAPIFTQRNKVERTIRWLFVLSLATVVCALVGVSAARGIDRGDLFEIVVISIVLSTLIVTGPLVAVMR